MGEKTPLLDSGVGTKGSKQSRKKHRLLPLIVGFTLAAAVSCLTFGVILLLLAEEFATAKTFKAAAYEQKLVSLDNATTRSEALVAMKANLANMEKQAEIASREVGIYVWSIIYCYTVWAW